MEITLEVTEKEIIRENAEYVLGMYDMYSNDQEIVDMLKMKGLNDSIVQSILIEVKKPAYVKRVKQAKVMIGIGSVLLVVFVALPYLVIHFTDSVTFIPAGQKEPIIGTQVYTSRGEGAFIVIFKFLLRIGFYVVLLAISQLAIGTFSFFKYKKLLRTV